MLSVETAWQAFQSGDLVEAERLCRQLLAAAADDPQASWLLSHLLARAGKNAEAAAVAAAGLAANPLDADLLTARGEALARLGRAEEAIECLLGAIERRLINPEAHAALSAVLAARNDPTPRFTVSVITPSIGGPTLARAIESVQAQDYPLVEHFLVADGLEYEEQVRATLPRETKHPVHLLALPFNVGGGGFTGHRVYGAAPFLVNGHFVAYLDEDNWYDPDHVSSLMARISAQGLAWAYALRKIVDAEGRFLANDDCESLGQWPIWNRPDLNLVDTNCYLLRRDLAIASGHLWYRRFRDSVNPDLTICRELLTTQPRCATNGRYTVNYRVAMTADSVGANLFLVGNAAMLERYGEKLPWRQ